MCRGLFLHFVSSIDGVCSRSTRASPTLDSNVASSVGTVYETASGKAHPQAASQRSKHRALLSIINILILDLETGTTVSSEPEEHLAHKKYDVQGGQTTSTLEDPARMSRKSVDGRPENDLGTVNE